MSNVDWSPMPEVPQLAIEFLRLLREESERMSGADPRILNQNQKKRSITAMAKGRLFSYAVLFHPKPTKDPAGNDTTPKSEILIKPTDILATTADQVGMVATRQIPKEYEDRLDLCEVIVKSFS